MKTALITGANKGIGFETARQLLQKGYFVYLGSRNPENGHQATTQLQAEGFSNFKAIQLDVTNQQSVDNAKKIIEAESGILDVLINNAGISGRIPQNALETLPEDYQQVLETNLYGVIRVTQGLMELLKKSDGPRIVNVSTSVGSLSTQSNPEWPAYDSAKYTVYATSKAAMNMYTVMLAYELRDLPFKVNAVCPGYTKTDFTYHQGTGTVEDAARRVIKYALIGNEGPTGKFFSEETNPETGEIAW